jgi:hypothetical protein
VADQTRVINITSGAPYDVYIGWQRPAWMWGGGYHLRRSPWHNPYNKAYRDGHMTVWEAIDRFHYDLVVKRKDLIAQLLGVRGKVLACWCKPGPCHGDVIARLADALGVDPAELVEG